MNIHKYLEQIKKEYLINSQYYEFQIINNIEKMVRNLENDIDTNIRGVRSNFIIYLTRCKNCGKYFYKKYDLRKENLLIDAETKEVVGCCNKCQKECE